MRTAEILSEALSYAWAINRDDLFNDITKELQELIELNSGGGRNGSRAESKECRD